MWSQSEFGLLCTMEIEFKGTKFTIHNKYESTQLAEHRRVTNKNSIYKFLHVSGREYRVNKNKKKKKLYYID